MISPEYKAQFNLLLRILPHVAKEECFALKGGTAINLFVRDLPRLSVDIDLTYLPFDDRSTALSNIDAALNRIKKALVQALPGIHVVTGTQEQAHETKLVCRLQNANVKVEVNTVLRGHIQPTRLLPVCSTVERELEQFVAMKVVSHAELFGGKICATLDRQHPRDLFDVHLLLENEGFSEDIRLGVITSLVSHPRPLHEMIKPNFSDQRSVFNQQFTGMTALPFRYSDYEETRERLVQTIHTHLTDDDRAFLIGFKRGNPDWNLVPIKALKDMPAVQWKLLHIQKLITENPKKNEQQLKALEENLLQ